jgi:phenylalanyl-tRNA synthetase alpha subunit
MKMHPFKAIPAVVMSAALACTAVGQQPSSTATAPPSSPAKVTTKANLEKAKETVRNIQQSEVKGSTGTATTQQIQQISKEQSAVEQAHQKDVSKKLQLDKGNVPAPGNPFPKNPEKPLKNPLSDDTKRVSPTATPK